MLSPLKGSLIFIILPSPRLHTLSAYVVNYPVASKDIILDLN
jgi:hypothetical protein